MHNNIQLLPRAATILLLFAFLLPATGRAQDSTSVYGKVFGFPDKFFSSVNHKAEKMQQRLERSTAKYLKKLSRGEKKLQRRLARKDSAAARELFGNVEERYSKLQGSLKDSTTKLRAVYSGHLDSMQTALNFLGQNQLMDPAAGMPGKMKGVFEDYGNMQQKLDQTRFIEQQLKSRQQYLKDKLQPFGLGKQLGKYQQQVYYYRARMEQYKNIFEQPGKLEAALLQAAKKLPAFRNFFNNHSQLAGLFRLPGSGLPQGAGAPGLQTRTMVADQLQQRLGRGLSVEQQLGSGIASAQKGLDQARRQLNKFGNAGSDMELGDFKPNEQKTKTLLQRLELGADVQSVKGNRFLPVTTDIGLRLGYRFIPKAVAGIGASYKLGWGQQLKHLHFTHEGLGLRSFVDLQLKGSFWISGGAEMNYLQSFREVAELNERSAWRRSALLGLTKKIRLKKSRGQVSVLYDFLWQRQGPGAQPLVIRTGYSLK